MTARALPDREVERDALLAAFDGKNHGLLIERPGEQAVFFDWSARGEYRPDGLHFDLQVPACAVAVPSNFSAVVALCFPVAAAAATLIVPLFVTVMV